VQRLRRVPVILSGAREDVLELCPSERVKFESLGYAVLITSGVAALSMWFALNSALGVNGVVAVPLAVIWGLVIMGIDRWLITSMQGNNRRKFLVAVPRLVLAVLLGTLISTPIVLRVFQSEINAQISVIKQQRYSQFLTEQQHSTVAQQVTNLRKQLNALQQVIDTRGAAPLDPGSDPDVKTLTSQLNYWHGQETYYYKQWQCQLYGGTGCTVKGNGPLAQTMHADYLNAETKTNSIQQQITQREGDLASTSIEEEKSRYDQAVGEVPGVQQQLSVAEARQNALQASYYAQNQDTNGILIRLQALSQLGAGDFTVTAAHWLLFLLFMVLEILPVTVKLMQRPGIYEEILNEKQANELGNAKRVFRGQPPLVANFAAASGAPSTPAGTFGPAADVRSIWNQSAAPHRPSGSDVFQAPTQTVRPPVPPVRPEPARPANRPPAGAAPATYPDPFPGQQADPFQAFQGQRDTMPDQAWPGTVPPVAGGPVAAQRPPWLGESGELPVLDKSLRAMRDDRISADSGGDGVQLNWDDE
jgi:hypothetical protein